MGVHSQTEIQAAWIAAGVTPSRARIASAIAMAESGGDDSKVSPTNDHGYMQINLPSHPDVSAACAHNFACATRAAIRISKRGTDFSPWTTYKNGEYEHHLTSGSTTGTAALPGPGDILPHILFPELGPLAPDIPLPSLSDPLGPFKAIASFFTKLLSLFYAKTWIKIGKVILGFTFILYGLNALVKSSFGVSPAGAVASGAKKTAEGAAAVAVVK